VILQQVLEVYVSILVGTHWEGSQMGGAPTEISPADWTAGYDGDQVNCESSSTPLRGTHNIKLLDQKSSKPKKHGKA